MMATVPVSGIVTYKHPETTKVTALAGVAVDVCEDDTAFNDCVSTTTDNTGFYKADIPTDDGVGGGRPDVFVRVHSRSDMADVGYRAPLGEPVTTYQFDTPTDNEIPVTTPYAKDVVIDGADDVHKAFGILAALQAIKPYVLRVTNGGVPAAVPVQFPAAGGDTGYNQALNRIRLEQGHALEWDVIHHEYAHYFGRWLGIQSPYSSDQDHKPGESNSVKNQSKTLGVAVGWNEGFANFFSMVAQLGSHLNSHDSPVAGNLSFEDRFRHPEGGDDFETEYETLGVGEDDEASVTATLWDLVDGARDGDDNVQMDSVQLIQRLASSPTPITHVGEAWEAIAAGASSVSTKARMGAVFTQDKIAPRPKLPADDTQMTAQPMEFTWEAQGGQGAYALNDFRVTFYSSDFSTELYRSEPLTDTKYKPLQDVWDRIRSEQGVRWIVEGRNTDNPETPGGALGYYWSGPTTLGSAPVGVVTVIDTSGSMDGQKLADAKEAAQDFIALRNDGDSLGVVSFDSTAIVGFPLTDIAKGSQVREQAQGVVNNLAAGGSTSIGAGLIAAFNELGSRGCSGDDSIVLLTDGEENTPPFVDEVLSQNACGARIQTIAFGGGANAAQLQQLSNQSGGEFFQIRNGESPGAAFARLSGLVNDEQDVLSENREIAKGETVERTFRVDATAGQLTVGVQWPGSDLDLKLVTPDGAVIERNTILAGVRAIASSTSEFFKVEQPKPGLWKAIVTGVDVDGDGEPYQLLSRVVSPLKGRVLPGPDVLLVGDRLPLQVLLIEGVPVLGATVTGTFTPIDGGNPINVTLLDDGQHRDGEANDGVYGAEVLAGVAGRGAYVFQATASGVAPSGAAFTRAPSRTFVVTGEGIAVEPYAPFLKALYQDLLRRNADQGGLAYWEQLLRQGVSRETVVDGFYRSAEHRGLQVDSYYADYLGRTADAGGRAAWIRLFLQGADETAVIRGFLESPEYAQLHDTEEGFVNSLYEDVLGRVSDRPGLNYWLDLQRKGVERAQIATGFLESAESRLRAIDHVYDRFLDRDPTASERSIWLERLESRAVTLRLFVQQLLGAEEFVEQAP